MVKVKSNYGKTLSKRVRSGDKKGFKKFDKKHIEYRPYTPLEAWYDELDHLYTLGCLAEALGISRTTLYRWLAGQMPTEKYQPILDQVTKGKVKRKDWL